MKKRPTIRDLADESGVSVATVDRVLNARTTVREETARRVYQAALKIGYHATSLIQQRMQADLPEYRLGFLLHKERQDFFIELAQQIRAAADGYAQVRIVLDIVYAPNQDPSDYAEMMRVLGRRNQAVAAIAPDHHELTTVVQELKCKGVACFSMMNDFAQGVRQSYIGLNNLKVGRGTGWMISKIACPGKVAIIVGGHRWHGHGLRETGMRSYFREYAKDFQVLEAIVNQETRQLTYDATIDLLEKSPDLVGLYCAGGGMEGAIAAVRELRRPEQLVFVVHEETPDTLRALQDRYLTMANVTPSSVMSADILRLMGQSIHQELGDIPGQHFLQQSYLFPEMVV